MSTGKKYTFKTVTGEVSFPVTSEPINMAASTRLGPKVSLLVHLLVFSWYVFTIWSNCTLQTSDRHPGVRSYGGRWKYLTFINLVSESACVLSVSEDVLASHVRVSLCRCRMRCFLACVCWWTRFTARCPSNRAAAGLLWSSLKRGTFTSRLWRFRSALWVCTWPLTFCCSPFTSNLIAV